MNKIRKGDQVIVLTGRDKGKRGAVLQRVDEERILVEGVNIATKHQGPRQGIMQTGIIDKEMPIRVSNVAVISPADQWAGLPIDPVLRPNLSGRQPGASGRNGS